MTRRPISRTTAQSVKPYLVSDKIPVLPVIPMRYKYILEGSVNPATIFQWIRDEIPLTQECDEFIYRSALERCYGKTDEGKSTKRTSKKGPGVLTGNGDREVPTLRKSRTDRPSPPKEPQIHSIEARPEEHTKDLPKVSLPCPCGKAKPESSFLCSTCLLRRRKSLKL